MTKTARRFHRAVVQAVRILVSQCTCLMATEGASDHAPWCLLVNRDKILLELVRQDSDEGERPRAKNFSG